MQNYPNPFNSSTLIRYTVAEGVENGARSRAVKLVMYDLLGREMTVLVNERKMPGSYELKFDASGLASGVCLYRLSAAQFVQTMKMVVVK